MLRLIISPPGTGKTTDIIKRLGAGAILIVPEQSHFETERRVYKKLGARAFSEVEITSFTKLGADILNRYKKNKIYASDTLREITMFKIICELKNDFIFYRRVSENGADIPKFAAQSLSAIEVFQREGISPEELKQASAEIKSPRLKAKITDLSAIYSAYNNALPLSDNYIDKPDEIRLAAQLASREEYFRGKNIYADGFDGFSGGQLQLLEAMMKQSASLTISLTADKADSKKPHYIITSRLIERLKGIAEKRGVEVLEESLSLLPARDPKDNTEIYLPRDVYAESDFVAAKIRELITTENYSQSEIAVLNPPSPETLASSFAAYGLREFSDIPEAVIEKPMVKFIITALEAAAGKENAVYELIKSGYMRVSGGGIKLGKLPKYNKITGKRTDDYVRAGKKTFRLGQASVKLLTDAADEWQLSHKDWFTPFPEGSGYTKAEKIRAEITQKIKALSDKISGEITGDKITEELTEFLLTEMEMGRTVADIVYRGQRVNSALNDEYRQLWETVISVLEAMHSALENQKISLPHYTSVLSSVLAKTMIAKPPQVIDAVTVGDLRRSRFGEIKVAFLMGANQGEFPKSTFTGADFSERETEELCQSGIFIEESTSDRYYRERFLIHRAFALATEKLIITAPLADITLKEKKPAQVVNENKEKIKNIRDLPLHFHASHKSALEFKAAENPRNNALSEALKKTAPERRARIFSNLGKIYYHHKIDKASAEKLLKKRSISPSRIELLCTCNFKYFCSAGLRIGSKRVLNDTEPDALTRGSMFHFVLERVLTELSGNDYNDFIEINPQEFIKKAEQYIDEFEEINFHNGYARSARKREILRGYAAGIAEVLKQIREDMAESGFRPRGFEKDFKFTLGEVQISGKIDRLDELKNGDERYIRVIDYKTGGKKFSYPEISFGLNLQALIYLFAIMQNEENLIPSGAFYRLINGGKLSKDARPYGVREAASEKQLYANRMETQRTSGLQFGGKSRADFSDIEAINNALKKKLPNKRSAFIELEALGEEDFDALLKQTAELLQKKLEEIYGGDVKAVPVYSSANPCEYCDYKGVCGNAGRYEEVRI